VARIVLRLGAGLWTVAGLAGLAVGVFGADAVARLLPPLAIDTDALGGAIAAVAAALLLVAVVHVLALAAWAATLAVLLTAGLAMLFAVLAVAAFTSAAVETANALALIGAGVASVLVGASYGLACARLIVARRSGSAR
jgi:hypothetical protein